MSSGTIDKIMVKIKSQRGLSSRVAEACGIERAAVYQWKRVPALRVHLVAPVIGMTPEEIRPDIFVPKHRRPSRAS